MVAIKSHLKSIVKALSFRVVSAVDTFAIAYLLTGKCGAAFGLVGLEFVTKAVWYYAHERAWEHPVLVKAFGTQAAASH